MSRYADLDLSLTRNPITGDVAPLTDAQAVSRSIQNIILTIAGEKKFNPTFGGSLRAMLFEQMDPFTTLKIKDGFTRAIQQQEPRANLIDLLVYPNVENNLYGIKVQFSLLNNPKPITVNFKLERLR
jgi:phage baseplate assembly protein W